MLSFAETSRDLLAPFHCFSDQHASDPVILQITTKTGPSQLVVEDGGSLGTLRRILAACSWKWLWRMLDRGSCLLLLQSISSSPENCPQPEGRRLAHAESQPGSVGRGGCSSRAFPAASPNHSCWIMDSSPRFCCENLICTVVPHYCHSVPSCPAMKGHKMTWERSGRGCTKGSGKHREIWKG